MTKAKWNTSLLYRVLLSIALCIFVLFFVFQSFYFLKSLRKEPERQKREEVYLTVNVQKLQRQNFRQRLVGYGVVRSMRVVNVEAEIPGVVKWISPRLEAGNFIKAGEKLVELDDRDMQQALLMAKAALQQAQANVTNLNIQAVGIQRQLEVVHREWQASQRELKRLQELEQNQGVSRSLLDNQILQNALSEKSLLQMQWQKEAMTPTIEQALAEVEMLKAQLQKSENDLARTRIYAPYEGHINTRYAQIGARVSPGNPLFHLVDLHSLEVAVALPASYFHDVKIKAGALLKLRKDKPLQWQGEVMRISPTIDSNSRTFQIFIELKANDLSSQLPPPGAFVTAYIDGRYYQDIFLLPRTAFIGNDLFLAQKIADGKTIVKKRSINVDNWLPEYALVKEGLTVGEEVIITNVEEIDDGSRVTAIIQEVR